MSTEIKDIPDSFLYEAAAANEAYIEGALDAYHHLSPSSKPEIGPRWVKVVEHRPADGVKGQLMHIKPFRKFHAYDVFPKIYIALIYIGNPDDGLCWHWYEGPHSGWHTKISASDFDQIEYLAESIPSPEP